MKCVVWSLNNKQILTMNWLLIFRLLIVLLKKTNHVCYSVMVNSTVLFKKSLDEFWSNHAIYFNFEAELEGTRSRSEFVCVHRGLACIYFCGIIITVVEIVVCYLVRRKYREATWYGRNTWRLFSSCLSRRTNTAENEFIFCQATGVIVWLY